MEQDDQGNPAYLSPKSKSLVGNIAEQEPIYSSPKPKISAGGDPVAAPTDNDVLSGRGGAVNAHPGNVRLRTIVNSMKASYLSPRTRKLQKTRIAAEVVRAIRSEGRFLKYNPGVGQWYEIGDRAAVRKAGQALRENSSEFRACWRDILEGNAAAVEDAETKKFSVVTPVQAPATPDAPSGDCAPGASRGRDLSREHGSGALQWLDLRGENELADDRMR